MDFIAIDFETANERRDSACAIGAVVVERGAVTERHYRLIRPKELRFEGINVSIHGIDEDDVAGEPEFPEIWRQLSPVLLGRVVVAHSAFFDMGVLRGVLAAYAMRAPELTFLCSMVAARKVWPGLSSYGLAIVAEHVGHRFEHHHAAEDAEAAAAVMVAALTAKGARDPAELARALDITLGRLSDHGYTACRRSKLRPSALAARTDIFDPDHPLFDKGVVFTGALESMVRSAAAQIVLDLGGRCPDSVNKETDYLVLGSKDYDGFRAGMRTAKLRKAEAMIARGGEIEIIGEMDFIRLAR